MATVINKIAGIATSELQPQKRTLVITGDSWPAGEIPTVASYSASKGIIRNLNALLGNYFEIVNFAGVGGERLDEIRARFSTDVLAYSPGYCVIIAGANDISQLQSAARSGDLMFADTKAMIDSAVSSGIIPIVFPCQATEPMFVNGAPTAGQIQDRADAMSLYNRMLLTYSIQTGGWIYVSKAWDRIIDHEYNTLTGSVNVPAILSLYQLDLGHVDHAGAFRIAKDVKNQIADVLQISDSLPRHYNDVGAGCWNPMQKVSGTPSGTGVIGASVNGTITNVPAEGWMAILRNELAPATCVITQLARTDIAGAYWNRCTCTSMDAGAEIELRESDTSPFNYIHHVFSDLGFSTGDVIELYFECRLSSISGTSVATGELNKLSMSIQVLESGGPSREFFIANVSSGGGSKPYIGTDFAETDIMVYSSAKYTIVDATDKYYLYASAGCASGATGTTDFTFDLGRIGIRKVA